MTKQTGFPFHQTAEDATNTAIIKSGKSHEEVAHAIWPELKLNSAYARLKNALRDDAREILKADQHIFIGNFCKQYDYLYYSAQESHHSQPEPVEAQDEAMQLDREINATLKSVEELLQRRERLQAMSPNLTKVS